MKESKEAVAGSQVPNIELSTTILCSTCDEDEWSGESADELREMENKPTAKKSLCSKTSKHGVPHKSTHSVNMFHSYGPIRSTISTGKLKIQSVFNIRACVEAKILQVRALNTEST